MIAILLSTYNGEKYIKEQIDSLLNQSIADWFLMIRDDGSSDRTIEIIKDYCAAYPQKILIDESVTENLGAGKSFMQLLEKVDADYYMFCDQDDVWMSDKIIRTWNKLKKLENIYDSNCPIGVFTDLEVVDSNLNVLMPSLWQGDNRHPEYTHNFYKQWINRHAVYGCTMMINKAAKQIVLPYRQFEGIQGGHDTWIEYNLIKRGYIDYLNETTIHYRQHGDNVIGANMGITYLDELKNIAIKPHLLFTKLIKDYKRTRLFPFKISFSKILYYRIVQSLSTIVRYGRL